MKFFIVFILVFVIFYMIRQRQNSRQQQSKVPPIRTVTEAAATDKQPLGYQEKNKQ